MGSVRRKIQNLGTTTAEFGNQVRDDITQEINVELMTFATMCQPATFDGIPDLGLIWPTLGRDGPAEVESHRRPANESKWHRDRSGGWSSTPGRPTLSRRGGASWESSPELA